MISLKQIFEGIFDDENENDLKLIANRVAAQNPEKYYEPGRKVSDWYHIEGDTIKFTAIDGDVFVFLDLGVPGKYKYDVDAREIYITTSKDGRVYGQTKFIPVRTYITTPQLTVIRNCKFKTKQYFQTFDIHDGPSRPIPITGFKNTVVEFTASDKNYVDLKLTQIKDWKDLDGLKIIKQKRAEGTLNLSSTPLGDKLIDIYVEAKRIAVEESSTPNYELIARDLEAFWSDCDALVLRNDKYVIRLACKHVRGHIEMEERWS